MSQTIAYLNTYDMNKQSIKPKKSMRDSVSIETERRSALISLSLDSLLVALVESTELFWFFSPPSFISFYKILCSAFSCNNTITPHFLYLIEILHHLSFGTLTEIAYLSFFPLELSLPLPLAWSLISFLLISCDKRATVTSSNSIFFLIH
jgi:hypothetical protein